MRKPTAVRRLMGIVGAHDGVGKLRARQANAGLSVLDGRQIADWIEEIERNLYAAHDDAAEVMCACDFCNGHRAEQEALVPS